MIILTIRTDKPDAEIGIYDDEHQLCYEVWPAHRQLAETIHTKLRTLLAGADLKFNDVQGIVVFQGPGSFTGLRIGITVANALAYSLNVPIVPATDTAWREKGIATLLVGATSKQVLPEYGALPHITVQKK